MPRYCALVGVLKSVEVSLSRKSLEPQKYGYLRYTNIDALLGARVSCTSSLYIALKRETVL